MQLKIALIRLSALYIGIFPSDLHSELLAAIFFGCSVAELAVLSVCFKIGFGVSKY
jgi:hypothetical protein